MVYLNELAPWERVSESHDIKEIKNQLTKQTAIAKKQLVSLSRDYPLAVANQYPYNDYLDENRYGVSDDAIYAMTDAMTGEIAHTMNQNAKIMDAGFNRVSGEINEQTIAMEKGMVGIALTQVASTELIRKTLNENSVVKSMSKPSPWKKAWLA